VTLTCIAMPIDSSQIIRSAMQLHQARRLGEAEALYRQLLAQLPQHGDALHYLGLLVVQDGRVEEGLDLMTRAACADPSAPHYRANLAHALKLAGRIDAAIDAWKQAIALQPQLAPAHAELAACLHARRKLNDALASVRRAIELRPQEASQQILLGSILLDLDRAPEAEAAFRRAAELDPRSLEAFNNLAAALHAQGRLTDAENAIRSALAISPASAEAHTNLGLSLHMQGRVAAAEREFSKAVELDPNSADAHGRLLFALLHYPVAAPLALYQQHVAWADRHASHLGQNIAPHANSPNPTRRLRIGYVSIDFRHHSVAYFLEPILASHDHQQFEIYCYADVANPDDATARFRGYADCWRDVSGISDAEIAELVRNDAIDILVDLIGHTNQRLLKVFARKPAPLQFTYLGYPATSGLRTMDYRITDALADPPGKTEAWHTEKLVRLPDSAWCYRPHPDAPPVAEAPFLSRGYVTFGSFNMLPKITPRMIALWSRILSRAPQSRLIVKARSFDDEPTRRRVAEEFAQAGIDPARLDLRPRTPAQTSHLADYGNIDIELDTHPYNGTTIICESLWMGVPVVTLAGQSHISRVGLSLLTTVGLKLGITHTLDDYISAAAALAADPQRLADLRAGMRQRFVDSPLRDEIRFTRNLERIYRTAWQAR
jgi:protein O-GlcNAc transferase